MISTLLLLLPSAYADVNVLTLHCDRAQTANELGLGDADSLNPETPLTVQYGRDGTVLWWVGTPAEDQRAPLLASLSSQEIAHRVDDSGSIEVGAPVKAALERKLWSPVGDDPEACWLLRRDSMIRQVASGKEVTRWTVARPDCRLCEAPPTAPLVPIARIGLPERLPQVWRFNVANPPRPSHFTGGTGVKPRDVGGADHDPAFDWVPGIVRVTNPSGYGRDILLIPSDTAPVSLAAADLPDARPGKQWRRGKTAEDPSYWAQDGVILRTRGPGAKERLELSAERWTSLPPLDWDAPGIHMAKQSSSLGYLAMSSSLEDGLAVERMYGMRPSTLIPDDVVTVWPVRAPLTGVVEIDKPKVRVRSSMISMGGEALEPATCKVRVVVDTDGAPRSIEPDASCPAPHAASVTGTLKGWRWFPHTVDGTKVNAAFTVDIKVR